MTCRPMLRLSTCGGGGVAPASRAAAKNVPVDCTNDLKNYQGKKNSK